MAASLLLACGLNEQKLPAAIHISEESEIDGSFFISSLLGQRLRTQNSSVILICLQQNYDHYMNAGMRLGYNLNMFKSKNLHVYEPVQELIHEHFGPDTKPADEINSQKMSCRIFDFIQKTYEEKFTENPSVTIFIDNLSILMNFDDSFDTVINFYRNLKEFVDNKINNGKSISLVTKLNNCELNDVLDNNLIRMSHLNVKIIKLKSGTFKEVDGKIVVTREEFLGYCRIEKHEKNILYKVNDRNIKIYNPGEVGIKV